MLLLTGKQAKLNDDYTQSKIGIPGLVLMERAALSIAERVETLIAEDKVRFRKRKPKVIAIAGMGNNGGDAVAAARILCQRNNDAAIVLIGNPDNATESMKKQLEIAGNLCVDTECCFVPDGDESKYEAFKNVIESADILIDGLFGVGLSRDLDNNYKKLIEVINASDTYKVAVDIPSGIDCTTGRVRGDAVMCNETITFGFMKYGLVVNEGRLYGGKVTVSEIGLEISPKDYDADDISFRAIPDERMKMLLPYRNPNSNKGTFGKILVVAGSDEIYGAAYLSAAAAYKTGAGLVKVFTSEVNKDNLMNMLPEAMIGCYKKGDILSDEEKENLKKSVDWADTVVVGPGLGTGQKSRTILNVVADAGKAGKCLIMDADAINICASDKAEGITRLEIFKKAAASFNGKMIITPHIAEMARLVRAIDSEDNDSGFTERIIDPDRDNFKASDIREYIKTVSDNISETAVRMAERFGITVVLKDARTHIASHGIGREVYVNLTGNSGMSTGGSGDVLTGIIAALVSGIHNIDEAGMGYFTQTVAISVKLHGAAGDAARQLKGERGMLATDIIEGLDKVLS